MRAVNSARQAFLAAALLGACWAGAGSVADAQERSFAPDKRLHFAVSAGVAFGCVLVLDRVELSATLRTSLSLAIPLGLGLGKEVFDAARGGEFSHADLAWDVVGVATGLVLAYLVELWLGPARPPDAAALHGARFGQLALAREQ